MYKRLIFLSIFFFGFTAMKLVKTKVAEGIMVSLPAELAIMTDEDIVQRYPSVRAPLAAFTDSHRTADFSVKTSATQWPDQNLEIAQKFFKSSITNLYDRVDFINQGISTINKKQFIFFEFESRVNGNKLREGEQAPIYRYTYIQYLIEKDRSLVFAFNCPKGQREEWQETIRAMMKTVKVK